MDIQTLQWVAMLVWGSTQTIADALGVHRTTALGRLDELERQGLVRSRTVGLKPTEKAIWLLTSAGVWRLFPHVHLHPGREDGHVHDPRAEELATHFHPSYWNSEAGARNLFRLLELKRQFYPLAINLFKNEGRLWHPHEVEASLLSFRLLRGRGMMEAIGEYEGNLTIFFHWMSLELSDAMLLARWPRRFADLIMYVEAAQGPVELDLPLEPDVPRASGNVLLVEDSGAFSVALRNLGGLADGRTNAWLVVCSADERLQHRQGLVRPTMDNCWDRHVDIDVGEPEKLCPPPHLEEQDGEGDLNGE